MENIKTITFNPIITNKEIEIIDERKVLGQDFKIYGDKENPLFLAKDVAEWIDYSFKDSRKINRDVSKMLNTVDEDEKTKNTVNLGGEDYSHGGIRENIEMWFLTEDGLYEVLMQSRKPIAKQFKKEVKKILKEIRLTGMYRQATPRTPEEIMIWQLQEQQKIKRQLNEVNHHALRAANDVVKLEEEFKDYKENDTLRVAECEDISDLVKKIGVKALGGKESNAYKDKGLRMKVYKNIWNEVRNQFDVSKYKQIKRKYFQKAKEVVYNYHLTVVLEEEINIINSQVRFI